MLPANVRGLLSGEVLIQPPFHLRPRRDESERMKMQTVVQRGVPECNYPRLRLWRSQVVTALRMVPNTLAPGVSRAVSTTVRTAASPSAAHIAR